MARDYNGDITTNVWDNWDLIEEHYSNDGIRRCYLHGAAVNEIVASFDGPSYGDAFYFQDGRGNVTHLTDDWNNVIEHYSYFVAGQPNIDDGFNHGRGSSIVDNRFLFKGALYVDSHLRNVPQGDMYNMRNRFYHPNLGRFLQSDPTGFDAGDMNLFRYCGNDPVDRSDPTGLVDSNSSDFWRNLTNFFTGNPSMGVIEAVWKEAWNNRLQAGLMMTPGTANDSGEGQGARRYARATVKIDHDESFDLSKDPMKTDGGQGANAKTFRSLGPPHAEVGTDGKIHFSQTLTSKTTFPVPNSDAIVNAEWKRVVSVRTEKVALDTVAREAARRYFSSAAEAEAIIGKATRREFELYKLRTNMLFDGINSDGGTK